VCSEAEVSVAAALPQAVAMSPVAAALPQSVSLATDQLSAAKQMELLRVQEGGDLSPQQLMEAANNWAKRNNFAPEQLQVISDIVQCEDGRLRTLHTCPHMLIVRASKV
jgi:hypothetical protein